MQKLISFIVDFFVGTVMRALQFSLFSASLAFPLWYFFHDATGKGYLDFLIQVLLISIAGYTAIRMIRLLWDSWRNEI